MTNEDSGWGPMMMFGVTGPGPKADRKPIPSDPKKEKGINIKNMNKMKKFLTFEEFVNEQKLNEGAGFFQNLELLRDSFGKVEQFAKRNGEDFSDLRDEYKVRLRSVVSDIKNTDKRSTTEVEDLMTRIDNASSFSEILDTVEYYGSEFEVVESLSEAIDWKRVAKEYTAKVGEWLRKGANFTVDKIIIPFVKYLLNVLSRLIVNIVIAIINSVTGKTYKAPDATIFKKQETSSDTVKFDERGYNINI
jgi:hypothetical protein